MIRKKVIEIIKVTFEEKPRSSDHTVQIVLDPPKSENFCFQVTKSESDTEEESDSNVKVEQPETSVKSLTSESALETLTPFKRSNLDM